MAGTSKANEALIIIDVQNDFCAGGALAAAADNSFISRINSLAEAYGCLVLTQDWHPAGHISFASSHAGKAACDSLTAAGGTQILWPEHCLAGTQGAAFHPALQRDKAALILRKGTDPAEDCYSAFYDTAGQPTGLAGFLHERGCEKLAFCGLMTDFCVSRSALDAVKAGFAARVALAACQALDINGSYERALDAMRQNGVELGLIA